MVPARQYQKQLYPSRGLSAAPGCGSGLAVSPCQWSKRDRDRDSEHPTGHWHTVTEAGRRQLEADSDHWQAELTLTSHWHKLLSHESRVT